MNPTTAAEWAEYFSTLEGSDLRSKTIACNTYGFVQMLLVEGLSMKEIDAVFLSLARQYQSTMQTPPGGGAYDLTRLLKENS